MKREALASDFDVERLRRMSLAELRALWPTVMGRGARPPHAPGRVLIRELAWRIQEHRSPSRGIDAETVRLLEAAVRAIQKRDATNTPGRLDAPAHSRARTAAMTRAETPPRPTRRRLIAELPASARLVRVYRGVRHEVLVLGDGMFNYRGGTYRSLTAIAQRIAGGTRSGPKFFGLTTTAPPTASPKRARSDPA